MERYRIICDTNKRMVMNDMISDNEKETIVSDLLSEVNPDEIISNLKKHPYTSKIHIFIFLRIIMGRN